MTDVHDNTATASPAPLGVTDAAAQITYETSRRNFLGRSGAVLGVAAVGSLATLMAACKDDGVTPPVKGKAVVSLPLTSDTDILKFALFLELLEADFYTKAVASGVLSGVVATLATSIRDHEKTHVAALTSALGTSAFGTADVSFNFGSSLASQASFLATAQTLEATGVGAYLGALGSIQSRSLRTTAGSIFTIEARHLAAVRVFNNAPGGPVPAAFETGKTPADVVAAVVGTGFVTKGLG